jgi:3,4-dihydroxy-2-butanone 4-phosphate synthase
MTSPNRVVSRPNTLQYKRIISLALQPLWALASDFQFHDHLTGGWILSSSEQPIARSLPEYRTTQTQNKHTHTYQISIPCVGSETTIPASERAKTVHALDRSATVTGI